VQPQLDPQLTEFFESGVSLLVGTRDARLLAENTRAMGLRVEPGGREITLLLPVATAERTLANLRDNGRVAVCTSRAEDHRSVQVKGAVIEIRAAMASERAIVERYRKLIAASWGFLGMPTNLTFELSCWPCHAVKLGIESIFEQTPGPGAGAPLRRPGAPASS